MDDQQRAEFLSQIVDLRVENAKLELALDTEKRLVAALEEIIRNYVLSVHGS